MVRVERRVKMQIDTSGFFWSLISFWDIILECLVEFHGMSYEEAYRGVSELKSQQQQIPSEYESIPPLIYNSEAFDVACELAGKEIDFGEHREAYSKILERHGQPSVRV